VEISDLVREAAATTVYITHDQAEAFALADKVGVLEKGRLVQAGTPEEIYTYPATPFVARFTGLAGELPVRIRDRNGDGTVVVEALLAGALPAARGGNPFVARTQTDVPVTGTAVVMIRPTGVRLCPSGANGHHLTGLVTDVAFRGRGYEHAIDVGGQIRLTGVLAETRAPRGDTVGLRLDPAGCLAFPS
jgi:iron(III) transport system ATP-binding protein